MAINLNIFGIRIKITANEEISGWVRHDYGFYLVEDCGSADILLDLHTEQYDRGRLPKVSASAYHDDYIVYDTDGLRIIDFLNGGISFFTHQEKKIEIFCSDQDRLYEIFCLSFDSVLGEELDLRGYHRIHCLALERSGEATILLLPPGAGKTTLALKFLQHPHIRVLAEDILLYRKGKLHGLHFRWGTCDRAFADQGRLIRREKHRDKILLDVSRFHLGHLAGPGKLILGVRTLSADCRLSAATWWRLFLPLFKSMVLGLELQQSLAYFLLRNSKDIFLKGHIGLGRLWALLTLLRRSRPYVFEMGFDIEANFRQLDDFVSRRAAFALPGFRKRFFSSVRFVFFTGNNVRFVRRLGIWLYRIGLDRALNMIKRELPETIAVYTPTDFNSEHFVVGHSDIDLYLIVPDMSRTEHLSVLRRYRQVADRIAEKFPFIPHIHLQLLEQLRWHEKSCSKYIAKKRLSHFNHMMLLQGQEVRTLPTAETDINPYELQCYYRQGLTAAVDLISGKEKYGRDLYLRFLYILRSYFVFVERREAGSNEEYADCLKRLEFDHDFCRRFLSWPQKSFRLGADEAIEIMYNMVRLLEAIHDAMTQPDISAVSAGVTDTDWPVPENIKRFADLTDKHGVQSVYYASSVCWPNEDMLLILINGLSLEEFRHHFYERLELWQAMSLGRMSLWLMTDKLFNWAGFLSNIDRISFQSNGSRLYGKPLGFELSDNWDGLTSFHFLNSILRFDSVMDQYLSAGMAYKILQSEKLLLPLDLRGQYERLFGPIPFDLSQTDDKYLFTIGLMAENLVESDP